MGKLAVLATQSHGVLTCVCDCVAKNVCLPIPVEIKPPQAIQNCRNDGKSSAAISGTDPPTKDARPSPKIPRLAVYVISRRQDSLASADASLSSSGDNKKKSNAAVPRTQYSCTWSSCQRDFRGKHSV